jgi:FdrA protein
MSTVVNRVRRGFYADSVALMRISRAVSALPGVEEASLMIGTPTNRALLEGSGLLDGEGAKAQADDLVVAIRASDAGAAAAALESAEKLLSGGGTAHAASGLTAVRTVSGALAALEGANLALISVPGEFAAAEARGALERGLHVMMFSDNVAVEDEVALKRLAIDKGLLLMGPDCGTALIGGAPIAFANVVPRGDVGLISASGTGLQEVSCLLAQNGRGVSHGIGVGGRDLKEAVGGLMTLSAFEALEADPATRHIVIISKPPARAVTERILARAARAGKPVTLCLLGAAPLTLPASVTQATTLSAAVEVVLGHPLAGAVTPGAPRKGWLRGLFCGGTLCSEAQLVLQAAGLGVQSNVPVPGADRADGPQAPAHTLIDLGDDDYTRGRPHPMIEPQLRNELFKTVLADPGVAVVLMDVVIGYGAHADPAGLIADTLAGLPAGHAPVVASVTGTDADPQGRARQVARLRAAGVLVAGSNAQAAALAARMLA